MKNKAIDCEYADVCDVTILDNNRMVFHAIDRTSSAQIHLNKEQAIQLRNFLNEFIEANNG